MSLPPRLAALELTSCWVRPGALLRLRLPPSLTALRLGGLDAATEAGELQEAAMQTGELQEGGTQEGKLQEAGNDVSPMQALVAACRMLAGRFRQGQEDEAEEREEEEEEECTAEVQGQVQGKAGALVKEAAGAQAPSFARGALERSPFCISVPRRPEQEPGSEAAAEGGEGQLGILLGALAPLGLERLALFADHVVSGDWGGVKDKQAGKAREGWWSIVTSGRPLNRRYGAA